ncbi:MAG: N-acetyltransferase family protein [Wenzhouxiangella sp.]
MPSSQTVQVRPARASDCAVLVEIYNHYIQNSTVTFEETPLAPEQMAARLDGVLGRGLPWLVAEGEEDVLGYAYAIPWRERSAYRYSVEVSAYVAPHSVGCGIGTALYAVLLPQLQDLAIHTALAVVPLPNRASAALYEKLGFAKVAHLKEVGFKLGRWVDVGYWQLNLAHNRKS